MHSSRQLLSPAAGAADTTGHPDSTYGYAVSGAFEFKNLPTGAGDSFKIEATYGKGAAKYVFGGTVDTVGAGRFASASGPARRQPWLRLRAGRRVHRTATGIASTEHGLGSQRVLRALLEPGWRTSLFGNYSPISYGGGGSAALIASLSAGGGDRSAATAS